VLAIDEDLMDPDTKLSHLFEVLRLALLAKNACKPLLLTCEHGGRQHLVPDAALEQFTRIGARLPVLRPQATSRRVRRPSLFCW
jgi:hypothetical protein